MQLQPLIKLTTHLNFQILIKALHPGFLHRKGKSFYIQMSARYSDFRYNILSLVIHLSYYFVVVIVPFPVCFVMPFVVFCLDLFTPVTLLNWGFIENNLYTSQSRGEVCIHTTLSKPHLWEYSGYVVVETSKRISFDNALCSYNDNSFLIRIQTLDKKQVFTSKCPNRACFSI